MLMKLARLALHLALVAHPKINNRSPTTAGKTVPVVFFRIHAEALYLVIMKRTPALASTIQLHVLRYKVAAADSSLHPIGNLLSWRFYRFKNGLRSGSRGISGIMLHEGLWYQFRLFEQQQLCPQGVGQRLTRGHVRDRRFRLTRFLHVRLTRKNSGRASTRSIPRRGPTITVSPTDGRRIDA